MTATDGARDLHIWIQYTPTATAKVEYILGLLAKVHNFFLCEDARRVKVNCMDALSSQLEILSCCSTPRSTLALDASACFAAHHLLAHVLMQMLAGEQGKISPDIFCATVWSLAFFPLRLVEVQAQLYVSSNSEVYRQNGWPWQDLNLHSTRRDSNPQCSDPRSDALSIMQRAALPLSYMAGDILLYGWIARVRMLQPVLESFWKANRPTFTKCLNLKFSNSCSREKKIRLGCSVQCQISVRHSNGAFHQEETNNVDMQVLVGRPENSWHSGFKGMLFHDISQSAQKRPRHAWVGVTACCSDFFF